MTWFGWLVIAEFALSAFYVIVKNDERAPLNPRALALSVLFLILFIVGILTVGTGSL